MSKKIILRQILYYIIIIIGLIIFSPIILATLLAAYIFGDLKRLLNYYKDLIIFNWY